MAKPRRTPLNCLEMSPIVEREVLPLRALTVWSRVRIFFDSNVKFMPLVERVRWAVNVVSDFIFTNPLVASKV